MAGRPRTPTNVLRMRGADKQHPGRFENDRGSEPIVTEPIGEPPKVLTGDQLSCWHEIIALAPAGVLKKSDALAVEDCARILADIRAGRVIPADRRLFSSYLARFGMTPSDRSRVKVDKPQQQRDNKWSGIG